MFILYRFPSGYFDLRTRIFFSVAAAAGVGRSTTLVNEKVSCKNIMIN